MKNQKNNLISFSILFSVVIFTGVWVYSTNTKFSADSPVINEENNLNEIVLPSRGVVLPVRWGDLGSQLIKSGVIDGEKFEALYNRKGGFSEEERQLLFDESNSNLRITPKNSAFLLNLFWALGLGNKNEILESGPMTDPRYGGAGRFASTGGWILSKNDAMSHYSKHQFIKLTRDQQALVERVSKNIYRPCCGNSAYFPDCNHGMAMLGFLELMASQGVGENAMYQTALQVNSYWFPNTYLTIAKYFQQQGVAWDSIEPKEILGSAYSSAAGYQKILLEVEPEQLSGGQGCGVL